MDMLNTKQSRELFERACRRNLGMGAVEFLERYRNGQYDGVDDAKLMNVLILRDFGIMGDEVPPEGVPSDFPPPPDGLMARITLMLLFGEEFFGAEFEKRITGDEHIVMEWLLSIINREEPCYQFPLVSNMQRSIPSRADWETEPVSVTMVVTEQNGRKWEKDIPIVGTIPEKVMVGAARRY